MRDKPTDNAASPPRLDGRDRVVATLTAAGPISRADLARRTGLAHSTVSAIVAELLQGRHVVELANGAGASAGRKGGRPAIRLALGRPAGVAVGIDIGKHHVRVAVADLAHNLLAEDRRELDVERPVTDIVASAAALVDDVLRQCGAHHGEVIGVGMGVPVPVHGTGQVANSTVLRHWVGVDVAQAMTAALRLPVRVDNDANLGALSEWMWGAARGRQHVAYLKLATSVGMGLIINGSPFRGAKGIAGEIAHTVIDPTGPICRCGNRGCLTMFAGRAILAALRPSYGAGLTLEQVITLARDGDAGCQRAITEAAHAIGRALAGACNLINPDCIVVGGVLGAADELLFAPLRDSLRREGFPAATEDLDVLKGTLGDRAEVLGAVALALHSTTPPLSAATLHDGH
jgi:predicted NBD/HSP70 family sugar kinase